MHRHARGTPFTYSMPSPFRGADGEQIDLTEKTVSGVARWLRTGDTVDLGTLDAAEVEGVWVITFNPSGEAANTSEWRVGLAEADITLLQDGTVLARTQAFSFLVIEGAGA